MARVMDEFASLGDVELERFDSVVYAISMDHTNECNTNRYYEYDI